ncbi:hypothetical protein OGAPHI_003538 [Ogataea philodendri]|uniref:Uncharacterized protein n=1 Tax=Ogataea philodendri TaxID=1378263 RepID=A0A9P8T586_9ASCO|nr:uncharacterized protein OGAPHI_003538 [Ogataea philodendri]KAH3666541.1 hypothetical protein OGAPHI_003538 [Ogataea philodendri]
MWNISPGNYSQAIWIVSPTTYAINIHRRIESFYLKFDLTRQLMSSRWSSTITILFTYAFVFITIRQLILWAANLLGYERLDLKVLFPDKPVHCSHVYVSVNIYRMSRSKLEEPTLVLSRPVVYYIEFGPDDYSDPDLGTTLGFLRRKVLCLMKESKIVPQYVSNLDTLQTSELQFSKGKRTLEGDEQFLCQLEVNTGDSISCLILTETE